VRPYDVQLVIDDRHFSQDAHNADRRAQRDRDDRAIDFVLDDNMSLGHIYTLGAYRYQWVDRTPTAAAGSPGSRPPVAYHDWITATVRPRQSAAMKIFSVRSVREIDSCELC
jgi:hypothetical protein